MAGMAQDRIASIEIVTPELLASEIVEETAFAWLVKCEGGCGRRIGVTKRVYIPLDFDDPDGQVHCREYTAPGARRCAMCGPWPGSPAALALESQRTAK